LVFSGLGGLGFGFVMARFVVFPLTLHRFSGWGNGMFVKLTKFGPRSYVQLVQAYRDDAGRPKQRTVATLRLDQTGDSVKPMHDGLSRLLGKRSINPILVD